MTGGCRTAGAPRRKGLGNDWGERKRRAAVVAAHRAEHGDWCPGYLVPAHAATDLTADHLVPVAAGGAEDGALQVLCRACNSRKRDGRSVSATVARRSRNW